MINFPNQHSLLDNSQMYMYIVDLFFMFSLGSVGEPNNDAQAPLSLTLSVSLYCVIFHNHNYDNVILCCHMHMCSQQTQLRLYKNY